MSRKKYKISVIVPVYNKSIYLKECIDSILSQTYQNMELILVDDGSTDGSGEICDDYAGKDKRVHVFHQKNGGPTAAVMTGLREASGDYYTFIDSDDSVSKEMLQEMAECLIGQKGEVVCCNHVLEKQRETIPVIQPLKPGIYEGIKLQKEIKDRLLGNENRIIPMSRCMKLCEKTIFDGNEKYYDVKIRMGDDFNLIYPALLNSSRIVIMEQALFYHYRYVEDSIVHGYDPDIMDSIERWYQAVLRIVREKEVADGEAKLQKEYCYMLMYVMKNELRNPDKNYRQKICSIFLDSKVRERIANTPVSVRNRVNALLYLGIQCPKPLLLWMLRKIIQKHDKVIKKNNRLVMYLHGGSGNHGCEAIVNSTCHMIEDIPKLLMTNSEKEDKFYSVAPLCDILQERKIAEHFFAHVWYYAWRAIFHDPESFMRYRFRDVLGKNRAPLYVSIGGDMYCYELSKKEAIVANSAFNRAGAKTVLWGCSIEPELLKETEVIADMKRYALITPRESITKQALADAGVIQNVKLFPDPAFSLKAEEIPLPERFLSGRTIGINISPMIIRYEKESGITIRNYQKLINYILHNSDNSIALIPHVMWKYNDDRLTLAELYKGYEDNDRVLLFPDMSCGQIKYVISQCRAFIGARTHATIAAYSSCVPTLVVGYSVKARGIARDLFDSEENYVLPVQTLQDADALIRAYEWLMQEEEPIRKRLREIMPEYCAKAVEAGEEIRKIWKQVTA